MGREIEYNPYSVAATLWASVNYLPKFPGWFGTWLLRNGELVDVIWNPWRGWWQSKAAYFSEGPCKYLFWNNEGSWLPIDIEADLEDMRMLDIVRRVSGVANEQELRNKAIKPK